MLHDRADHALGRRPRAVGGADRLHDVLEDGRAAEHSPGAGCSPGEIGVLARRGVERGEILVQSQDVSDVRRGCAPPRRRSADGPDTSTRAGPNRSPEIRTSRGRPRPAGSVTSSTCGSARRIGGSSLNPWESRVRHRSTGSPPAPLSASSSVSPTRLLPLAPRANLVAVPAPVHRTPSAGSIPRSVVEHRAAVRRSAFLEAGPPTVEPGEVRDREHAAQRPANPAGGRLNARRAVGAEAQLQPGVTGRRIDGSDGRRRRPDARLRRRGPSPAAPRAARARRRAPRRRDPRRDRRDRGA